jgi:hypothetical protein
MPETPPGSFPVVAEAAIIRFRLGALVAIAGILGTGLIGGTVWATKLAIQLDGFDHRLGRIEQALGINAIPDLHKSVP